MYMGKIKLFDVISITLFISLSSSAAYAYIDPGSGSIILASIVAGFVAIRTAVKLYWQKFCALFAKSKKKVSVEEQLNSDKDKK